MELSNRARKIAGLYAIADSEFNPCGSLADLARKYLEGGCRIVQLRMKNANCIDEVEREAREVMKLKDEYDFAFILNDYVDVALEIGADGVHVGENDEPVASIRGRTDDRMIIGYSSHSKDEAVQAESSGADYVALGAVFPTRTKGPGHPVQGLSRLEEAAQSLAVPLVAIGGIDRSNVESVLRAGASAVAMITALSRAPDVVAETRWFVDAMTRDSEKQQGRDS